MAPKTQFSLQHTGKWMHPILKMLAGGDRRSIGKSNEIVELVSDKPELFEVLIHGMSLPDPLIRMRCADAAEKITALHPKYLAPFAAMLPRLPLNDIERQQVANILLNYTNDRSSIVKTFALQALADLTVQNENLRPAILQQIESLCETGTPAMRARGKRLLQKLRKSPS